MGETLGELSPPHLGPGAGFLGPCFLPEDPPPPGKPGTQGDCAFLESVLWGLPPPWQEVPGGGAVRA